MAQGVERGTRGARPRRGTVERCQLQEATDQAVKTREPRTAFKKCSHLGTRIKALLPHMPRLQGGARNIQDFGSLIVQEFAFFASVLAGGWGESQKETRSGRGPDDRMALAAWTWYNKALQHPNTPDRCGPMYAEVTPGWNVFKPMTRLMLRRACNMCTFGTATLAPSSGSKNP
jgi:hypothetical protein